MGQFVCLLGLVWVAVYMSGVLVAGEHSRACENGKNVCVCVCGRRLSILPWRGVAKAEGKYMEKERKKKKGEKEGVEH